jgi:hypothetical protein
MSALDPAVSMATWATWIPCGPNSRHALCANACGPALAAAKCAKPRLPRRLAEAPVKITVLRSRGTNRCAAPRPTRKPPSSRRAKILRKSRRSTWQPYGGRPVHDILARKSGGTTTRRDLARRPRPQRLGSGSSSCFLLSGQSQKRQLIREKAIRRYRTSAAGGSIGPVI